MVNPPQAVTDLSDGRLQASGARLERYRTDLGGSEKQLDQAARDFESLFLSQLIEKMMPTEGSFFGKEQGSETFQGFFVDAISRQMASRDVLGLKNLFHEQYARDAALATGEPTPGTPSPPRIEERA